MTAPVATARPRRRLPVSGFTLIEILVAVFFFSIIVTTLLASYTTVLSKAAAVEKKMAFNRMVEKCLRRMTLDLQSVYVQQPPAYTPPGFDTPPDPFRLVSAPNDVGGESFATLRFTTQAHLNLQRQPRQGIAEVVYYVQPAGAERFVLRRADRLFFEEAFEPDENDPILCTDVRRLAFRFFDREGESHERWDSESDDFDHATPAAVAVTLEVGDEGNVLIFDTRVALPVFRDKVGTV